MIRPPPRSPLFPYPTLFRSHVGRAVGAAQRDFVGERDAAHVAPQAQPLDQLLLVARRSEEHTSELQSQSNLVCRLLLEKKKKNEKRERHSGTHTHTH